jgi:hypothetical protein
MGRHRRNNRSGAPLSQAQNNVRKSLSPEQETKLVNMVSSVLQRNRLASRLNGQQYEGARDLYAVLGYKADLRFDDYLAAYDRGDIATRIINAPPKATWRRKPVISTDKNPDKFTEFETAWVNLAAKRKVFHYLERADKLAGVGSYGVLLMGTDDVRNEEDMARPMARLRNGTDSLLYLTPFMEGSAEIVDWDNNHASERFGQPSLYRIDVAGAGTGQIGANKLIVHWSRVLHIAEELRENDYIGTPRLQHVFNRLHDLDKIAGGSAEIFWQVAQRILILEAKDGVSAVDDNDELTQIMDELVHGMRRVIDLEGYEVKQLPPADVKPDEAFRVTIALISSATGIPQRILIGSEEGKMASNQDETNWNGLIADRQLQFAEPGILRPFIDRLIAVGCLPQPENDYVVTWPTLFEMSDKEKAQVGLLKARAVATWFGKGGENVNGTPGKKNSLTGEMEGGTAGGIDKIVTVEELRGDFLNLRAAKVELTKRNDPGQADSSTSGGPSAGSDSPAADSIDD